MFVEKKILFKKVAPPSEDLVGAAGVARPQCDSAPPLSYLHQQKKQREDMRRRHAELSMDEPSQMPAYQARSSSGQEIIAPQSADNTFPQNSSKAHAGRRPEGQSNIISFGRIFIQMFRRLVPGGLILRHRLVTF